MTNLLIPLQTTTRHDQILLIGHGSRNADSITEYHQFAHLLANHLNLSVQSCFLELADPPIVDGIRQCVDSGAQRIIALPLFLGAAGHQKNDVPAIINWAKAEWPDLAFKYGTPLGVQPQVVEVLADRASHAIASSPAQIAEQETAIILVGRGSRDPDSNSEVYKIARLLWEGRDYGWVEVAMYGLTKPTIEATLDKCVRLGAKRVVVLPYLLFTGVIARKTGDKALAKQADYPEVEILVGHHLGLHPKMAEAVAFRYQQTIEGTAAMTCDVCKYRTQLVGFENEFGLPQYSDHSHGLRGVPHAHGAGQLDYERALAEFLPPQYQNGAEVSPAPMSAAELVYDAEGNAAWDQIWQGFCDLAMAGGPAHRNTLLEPASPEAVKAKPDDYEAVLTELERGIRLVSTLSVVESESLGWVGVVCDSEEMALWLLRAIIVENVSVRREGKTLYLPAGPDFTLYGEIKNVVTVIAKTFHYWTAHIAYQRAVGVS